MILSDRDIKFELERGELKILPSPTTEDIQPASLDVHLGHGYLVLKDHVYYWQVLDTHSDNSPAFYKPLEEEEYLEVPPHGLVIAKVAEYLELPNYIACQIGGKSSLGRLGLSVHVTAGFVDPGWSGNLTLELANATDWPIRIHVGDKIAQLIFYYLNSPSERLYDGKYKYATQAQISRTHLDY